MYYVVSSNEPFALAEDINTQQSFEQLNPRAVGVVVDPIQSVKGKVVIDCFSRSAVN